MTFVWKNSEQIVKDAIERACRPCRRRKPPQPTVATGSRSSGSRSIGGRSGIRGCTESLEEEVISYRSSAEEYQLATGNSAGRAIHVHTAQPFSNSQFEILWFKPKIDLFNTKDKTNTAKIKSQPATRTGPEVFINFTRFLQEVFPTIAARIGSGILQDSKNSRKTLWKNLWKIHYLDHPVKTCFV